MIMPLDWILRIFLLFLWTLLSSFDAIILPSVHWNATNPMFKASNNDHIMEVNLNDEVDFECPYFSHHMHPEDKGFYIIYQVSYDEYRDCFIATPAGINMIVNCSSPRTKKRFTIIFESFSPVPNGQEFQAGGTYHYISTSSGYEHGVGNQQGGACYFNNMRLTIQVCCQTTTISSTVPPKTTPSSTVYQFPTSTRKYSYRWHPRTPPPWIPPKYTVKPAGDPKPNEVWAPMKDGLKSGASSYRCPMSHSLLLCQLAQILYILLR